MDTLTFVAGIVSSLAWPAGLLAIFLLSRKALLELLSPESVTHLSVHSDGLEISREVTKVIEDARASLPLADGVSLQIDQDLSHISAVSPMASVLISAGRLEGELQELVTPVDDKRRGLSYVVGRAVSQGLLDSSQALTAHQLIAIRDLITHSKSPTPLAQSDALWYDAAARSLVLTVTTNLRRET